MINKTNEIQKIAYGSKSDLPNFTKKDWSIDSFTGRITRLIKWNNIWGENQKILSNVSDDGIELMLALVSENKKEAIKIIVAINKGNVSFKDCIRQFGNDLEKEIDL